MTKRTRPAPPPDLGLGRRKKIDSNDEKHLIKSLLPKRITATSKHWWTGGWWGNQLTTPHCVGFSWVHWLEDGPITQPGRSPIVDPSGLYRMAQKVDEWTGENYDGTSVRAGAKVLKTLGFIGEYLWAWDLPTLVNAVLTTGPVVVGTNWYYSMFFPEKGGILKVEGYNAGGHAYLVNGVNTKTGMLRIKNSWGRDWANKGHALISFEDMERLIKEDGEVCIARELRAANS